MVYFVIERYLVPLLRVFAEVVYSVDLWNGVFEFVWPVVAVELVVVALPVAVELVAEIVELPAAAVVALLAVEVVELLVVEVVELLVVVVVELLVVVVVEVLVEVVE